MKKQKVTFSWSGGKDSALALHKLQHSEEYEVVSLHTSFDKELRRVGMHGIPEALIDQQAASIGLPLEKIYLEKGTSHEAYEKMMKAFCLTQKEKGIEAFGYGDIFLEDLKEYREKQLQTENLMAVFPLWKIPTNKIIEEFLALGFNTMLCCLNAELLPKNILGKPFSEVKDEISSKVDPCGENGEFHTFVYQGPIFKTPIEFVVGRQLLKTYDLNKEEDGKIIKIKHEYWFQELTSVE